MLTLLVQHDFLGPPSLLSKTSDSLALATCHLLATYQNYQQPSTPCFFPESRFSLWPRSFHHTAVFLMVKPLLHASAGLPCRSSTKHARCHAGSTISQGASPLHGWPSMRAASPQSKAASTSGTLWPTWRPPGPTHPPCSSTGKILLKYNRFGYEVKCDIIWRKTRHLQYPHLWGSRGQTDQLLLSSNMSGVCASLVME